MGGGRAHAPAGRGTTASMITPSAASVSHRRCGVGGPATGGGGEGGSAEGMTAAAGAASTGGMGRRASVVSSSIILVQPVTDTLVVSPRLHVVLALTPSAPHHVSRPVPRPPPSDHVFEWEPRVKPSTSVKTFGIGGGTSIPAGVNIRVTA